MRIHRLKAVVLHLFHDITLHDPQYAVDRTPMPEVHSDDVDIWRNVTGIEDAHAAVDEMEEMHPGEFRVSDSDADVRT